MKKLTLGQLADKKMIAAKKCKWDEYEKITIEISKRIKMKRLSLIAAILIALTFGATAQTKVKQDAQGNYTAATVTKTTKSKAVETGKFFTDSKGVKYPVYKSVNGKLFYRKVSKSGNTYNVYITL